MLRYDIFLDFLYNYQLRYITWCYVMMCSCCASWRCQQSLWKGLSDLCHIYSQRKVWSAQRREQVVRSIGRVVEHIFLSEPLQRFCMLFYHRFHLKFFKTLIVWWFSSQNRHQSEICRNARHLTEAPAPCFSNPFIHGLKESKKYGLSIAMFVSWRVAIKEKESSNFLAGTSFPVSAWIKTLQDFSRTVFSHLSCEENTLNSYPPQN